MGSARGVGTCSGDLRLRMRTLAARNCKPTHSGKGNRHVAGILFDRFLADYFFIRRLDQFPGLSIMCQPLNNLLSRNELLRITIRTLDGASNYGKGGIFEPTRIS